MELTSVFFIILGALACALSAALVTRRYPVSAAMLLITVFVLLSGMYGLLDAHFAAATQIIVYAGAIMVVFVFVIMLLNLPPEEMRYGSVTAGEWLLIFIGIVAALFMGTQIGSGVVREGVEAILPHSQVARPVAEESLGDMRSIAGEMFTGFLWPFELISFLIMASMVGAIVIAKKRGAEDAQSP